MEHYAYVVYLLGRVGHLYEAGHFINNMPFDPSTLMWETLLQACRIYGNTDLGKHATKCLLENNLEDTTIYVLLSNIYVATGIWDEAVKIRRKMKDKVLIKDLGSSWIKVKNMV
jgi:hypothetical protein